MAGLFEYTPTQSTVQASTPTVQVAAKTSNAFKSLSGLVDTYQQFQLQEKQRESQIIQAETALLRTEQALSAEEARKAKEKAKNQKDLQDTADNIKATKLLADAEAAYYTQIDAAGGDISVIDEAFRTYNTTISTVYDGLNDTNKKALDAHYFETRNRIGKEYRADLTKLGVTQNRNDVIAMMPAYLAGNLDSRKVIFEQMQKQGIAFGETPKSFGDNFAATLRDYMKNTVDEVSYINNLDYAGVDALAATASDMYAIDPRSGNVTDETLGFVKTLRGKLDTKLNSYINGAIEVGDKATLDKYMALGIEQGRKTEEDKNIAYAKYLDKINTPAALAKKAAQKDIQVNNGLVHFASMSPEVAREAKPLVITELRRQLYSNNPDVNYITWHLDKNPEVAVQEFNGAVKWHLSNALSDAKKAGSKQEAFALTANAMQSIDRLMALGKYTPNPELLQDVNTFKAVALSGNVSNIEEAYAKIAEKGGVKNFATDNPYIVKITENVSDDMLTTAIDSFEAYVASGVLNKDEALEVVNNSFSFESVGDLVFEASKPAVQKLLAAGMTQKALETAFDRQLMESSVVSDLERKYLENVMAGTEVRMYLDNNNLKFKNSEGDTATVVLSNDEFKTLVTETNALEQSEIKVARGSSKVVDVLTDGFSVWMDNTYNQVAKPLFIDPWIVNPAVSYVNGLPSPQEWADSFSAFAYDADTLVDDIAFTDKSIGQSIKDFNKKQNVLENILLARLSPQVRAEYKAYKENNSSNQLTPEEAENNPDSIGSMITNGFQSIIDFFVGKAEAGIGGVRSAYDKNTNQFDLDAFYSNIGSLAEGRHGYNAKTDTFTPAPTNDAAEKDIPLDQRTKDIGYGHKVQESEMESGMIHGIRFYNPETKTFIPLTESEARIILKRDMATNLSYVLPTWNKRIAEVLPNKTFNDINPQAQAVLTSLAYNVKGKSAKKWDDIFDNLGVYSSSMDADEVATFALDLRRKENGVNTKGMDNRVMKELVAAGLITSQKVYDKVVAQLPLRTEFDTFASTQF